MEKQRIENSQSRQTHISFSDKWNKNKKLAFEISSNESSDIFNWIMRRNGFKNKKDFMFFLSNKKRILDAGCGNGRVTKILRDLTDSNFTEILGIDFSSNKVAKENLKGEENLKIHFGDLRKNLSKFGKFDFIYCQEVLHHTGDAFASFSNLEKVLKPSGEIAIYVYKKKSPIREYTDEYIREKIKDLPYEKSMDICRQITELGKVLSSIDKEIQIPNVDILEIEKGTYSFQRFFYHFFMKCFWNDDFNFEDNSVINYDWYHPKDCTKHTLSEVKNWFLHHDLKIVHEYVDYYGITIRGRKNNE